MRYRRPFHLATRVVLLSIFLGSPAAASPQSSVEQPTAALPKPWNDAVAQLADKIAASVSPSAPITLDLKNISSLDASYTGAIENAFQSSLRGHSFNVVSSNSASAPTATQLHLTLSESANSYIWVVEIRESPARAFHKSVKKARLARIRPFPAEIRMTVPKSEFAV